MFEAVLLLSGAVVAAVEFIKSVLMGQSWFAALQEQTQSAILQFVAFVAGILAAYSGDVNVFAALPAFASAPSWLGVIVTGLIAATGSAGIHALLALIGVRGNVTAETRSTLKAQSADMTSKRSYSPFL